MPSETSSAQANKPQESDLQPLNPEDYEIGSDENTATELTTRRKPAGKPKVKPDAVRPTGSRVAYPGLGNVTIVIH